MVLEKTLESPLDSKEIKPVNPKGESTLNIPWKDWCWRWNSNSLVLSLLYCYCYSFKLFFGNNKDSVKNSHTPFTQIHELLTFCHNWFYHIFLNHMRLSCKYHALLLLENLHFRDFPGSPGVKTLQFQCREHRFDPWLGNFPACHAVQPPKTCIS